MYASITESKTEKGTYGLEIGNSKEVIKPWRSLEDVEKEQEGQTLRDAILLRGFEVIGKWSLRNNVSRVIVRPVPLFTEPLDSPAPEHEEFLE